MTALLTLSQNSLCGGEREVTVINKNTDRGVISCINVKSSHFFDPRQDLRTEPGDVPHRCCAARHIVFSGTSSHGYCSIPAAQTKIVNNLNIKVHDHVVLYKEPLLVAFPDVRNCALGPQNPKRDILIYESKP